LTAWRLRCKECGSEWVLKVSYDISDMKTIYHYCRKCRKNTFHEVLGRLDDQ
jgi:ribosomal protein L44E